MICESGANSIPIYLSFCLIVSWTFYSWKGEEKYTFHICASGLNFTPHVSDAWWWIKREVGALAVARTSWVTPAYILSCLISLAGGSSTPCLSLRGIWKSAKLKMIDQHEDICVGACDRSNWWFRSRGKNIFLFFLQVIWSFCYKVWRKKFTIPKTYILTRSSISEHDIKFSDILYK